MKNSCLTNINFVLYIIFLIFYYWKSQIIFIVYNCYWFNIKMNKNLSNVTESFENGAANIITEKTDVHLVWNQTIKLCCTR